MSSLSTIRYPAPAPIAPWWVDFGGVTVEVVLHHSPVLDRHLRSFLTSDVQRASRPGKVDFVFCSSDAAAPAAPDDTFDVDGMQAQWNLDGMWAETRSGVLVGDGPRFVLHRSDDDSDDPYDPFMAVMGHLGWQMGWNALHAGIVHSPAGPLLLIGESGKGKSTTSAACLAMGWSVDSDDVTFARRGPGPVQVLGLPRVLSVPDEAIPDSHRAAASSRVDHRTRRSVREFARIGGWHEAVAILEVDHGVEADSRLESISRLELIQGLLRNQAVAGSIPGRDDSLAELLEMLATLPARRLALGTDRAQRMTSTQHQLVAFVEPMMSEGATC